MRNTKEIKFRDHGEALVGRQNGVTFIIRTEPGVIASTPSHWVTVIPGDGAPNLSTLGHQHFHLGEAKEFCQRIAAGEIDLEALRAQYDAEDLAVIRGPDQDLSDRVVLFRERLRAKGLSYPDYLELEQLRDSLGEEGHQVLLALERRENTASSENPSCGARSGCDMSGHKNPPGRVEAPPGAGKSGAYCENISIIP